MTHRSLNSRDHYVSRTYLKHFCCSPEHVFMYRKKEKFEKAAPVGTICCEPGGDICEHFTNKFVIREILSEIEPKWNIFINAVKNKNIVDVHKAESKAGERSFLESISLYIAYLRCLSPVVNKLAKEAREGVFNKFTLPLLADFEDERLDEDVRQSIRNGEFRVEIGDKQYYKAMGVHALLSIAVEFYERDWEVLINKSDVGFITSDTPIIPLPVAELLLNEKAPIYLPLTSNYALLIRPNQGWCIKYRDISRVKVKEYNKEIVKWAVDKVISSADDTGVSKLVDKYRNYEAKNEFVPVQLSASKQVFVRHKTGLKEGG